MREIVMPNKYQQQDGLKLGLTREQVLTPNFGAHTINAIQKEIEKGVELQVAFKKYSTLNIAEVDGITKLGLTREHVLTPNFGYHTLYAVKDILKRTKELSSDQAFEMVKGKSSQDTKKFVESYLSTTKKAQKPIDEMGLIRVVVNTGRCFGHQRSAITLMQKLREMGFNGTFDIQCDDRIDADLIDTKTGKMYKNTEPLVSPQLIGMIPGFESSPPNGDGIRFVAGLGNVKISSLPDDYRSRGSLGFIEADLAVCAADDDNFGKDTKAKTFNARSYIGLEPTDWHQGSCFVTDQDSVVTQLPPASTMRLSSRAASQLPDISSIALSKTEERILDITRGGTNINSQLVYGLYPEKVFNIESKTIKESGNLDEAIEMQRIVEANLVLSKKTGKPSILLLPQKVALDANFISKVKVVNDHIHFLDLTKDKLDMRTYQAGDVVVAYTGHLQQIVFDHLMLQGTTLPPVIEGCNSREICESAGRPFIHGSGKHDPLKQYDVRSGGKQELHTQASLCLEKGIQIYVPQLVQYMEESLKSNPELTAYQQQRRESFFTRPDACEVAFEALGIEYRKSPSLVKEKLTSTTPTTSPSSTKTENTKKASRCRCF
ncbi:MAG: hypothetical protein FJX30_05495 [Alphaproteobacteria bacterium]|nr:hypothetical protein [Alphaproteobacteria bacterium]